MQSITRTTSGLALSPVVSDIEQGVQTTSPSTTPMSSQASPASTDTLSRNPALAGVPRRPVAATNPTISVNSRPLNSGFIKASGAVAVFGTALTAAGGTMIGIGVKQYMDYQGPHTESALGGPLKGPLALIIFGGTAAAMGTLTVAGAIVIGRVRCW